MNSNEFQKLYKNGELLHEVDYSEWWATLVMIESIQQ